MRTVVVILCLLFNGVARADETSARVTLDDAKKFAISHNFEVLARKHELEEKRADTGIARSKFFPTIGLAGGTETSQGGKSAGLAYAYANYNIFRGFGDTLRSQLADIEVEIAEIKLRQTEFHIGLTVEEAFHLYLFKKKLINLKEEALRLNVTHKGMAAKRRGAGMGSTSDVMEFELRDSILRSDVMLHTQELEEVRIRLRTLLGEEVGSKIEPVGGLQHQHLKGSLMDYLTKIKDTSQEVKLANRELARGTVESRMWRQNWLPQLDLEAQVGYLNLDTRPNDGGLGVRGLALAKFDLFSGFSTAFEKRSGEAKLLRTEAQLKQSLQSVLGATEIAYRRLKTIQDRVDVEEENEDRSQRYYNAVVEEYRRGVKNSADVKVAAESLFEARSRRESFKYEFLKEKTDLERAIGRSIETDVLKEN